MRSAFFLIALAISFGGAAMAAQTEAIVIAQAPATTTAPADAATTPTAPPATATPAVPAAPPAAAPATAPAASAAPAAPAAAPATAPAASAAPAPPVKLVGMAAWAQLVGNSITGKEDGETVVEFYGSDGTAKNMTGNEITTGKWALVGETICFSYPDNDTECFNPTSAMKKSSTRLRLMF